MEPGVPFALLGAAALLGTAAWTGLAVTALLRAGRRLPADRPAVLLAAGALLLAGLEVVTASASGRSSSDLLVLGRGLGLLLVGAGLHAGALARRLRPAAPLVPALAPGALAGVVVPLGAGPAPAVLAAAVGVGAALGSLRTRRDAVGVLLAVGLVLAAAGCLAAPGADAASGAFVVLLLRGASALCLLAVLVALARASLLGKVVAAILAGVLAMATASVAVVGTVVANGYDREQASLVSSAADGRTELLGQTLDSARAVAVLAADACTQRPGSCTAVLSQLSPPGLSTFAARVPAGGTAQSLGGTAPLDPAEVVALSAGAPVRSTLDGSLGRVPAEGLPAVVRLVGGTPGLGLVVAVPTDRPTPEAPPAAAFVYGVRLDDRFVARDFESGDFGLSLLVEGRVVASNLSAADRAGLERRAAAAGASLGAAGEQGVTLLAEGRSPTVHLRTLSGLTGEPVGTLALSRGARTALAAQQQALRALLITALATMALVGGLALVLGRRTVEPVRRLTAAATRLAAGDLSVSTGMSGRDEVGTLGATFDAMSSSVSRLTSDLRATAGRLETVLASMSDALIAADAAGLVTSINPAARQLVGDGAEAAVGRPLSQVLDLRVDARPLVLEPRLLVGQAAEVHRRDGTSVPVRVSLAPLDDGQGLVLVLRDTTAERQVERMKTEFLSNISHELRTPLTPIRGYAEILVARPDVPADRVAQYAATIRDESLKLNRVVDLLVDVAAIEAGRVRAAPRSVAPAQLVDARLDAWRVRAPDRAGDLRRGVASRLPDVLVDPAWIGKALDELVDNAVKHTPPGATITLTATLTGDGQAVRVGVRDAGPGLRAEDLGGVFAAFEQVDGSATRAVGGLGLGLSFVRRLADDAALPLSVTSTPGRGAHFALDLPVSEVPAPRQPAPRRPGPSRPGRSRLRG